MVVPRTPILRDWYLLATSSRLVASCHLCQKGYHSTAVAQGSNTNYPGNIGIFEQNEVAYVPEAAIKMEYVLRGGISVSAGYHLIYWSSVMLAGDQLDTTLNQRVINGNVPPILNPANPAEVHPVNSFRTTDFWSQSLSLGLTWRY